MVSTVVQLGSAVATSDERPGLAESEGFLRERTGRIYLADEDGHRVALPETAVDVVHQVLAALARGNPVEVTALPAEFTVQRAAEMLDVRPEDVVRLLDEGEIPAVHDGDFRRIRFQDVMAYKPKRDADRRAAMDQLIRLGEEMGLYDADQAAELAGAVLEGDASAAGNSPVAP